MKFYLSSYKIGNEIQKLKSLTLGKKIGFIPNAIDHLEPSKSEESNKRNMQDLVDLGIDVEMLDLKLFFNKKEELKNKMNELGGVWVRGGNVFVLRQAMKLSGIDEILIKMNDKNFFYGGYSAGGCVLSPNFRGWLELVDDPNASAYDECEVMWEGLGLIDYAFVPHYKSDHPESKAINDVVNYCIKNEISFKALRDGEVIIKE